MNSSIKAAVAGAAAFAGALAMSAPAQAAGVKAGVLQCNEAGGWGLVFGASNKLKCTFSPVSGPSTRYTGDINQFGVDIGYQKSGVIIWAVLAPTGRVDPGALQGRYGGVSASATVGVGAGGNFLVGGLDRSFTLQPLSVEGATGLNLAGGISGMNLHYEGVAGSHG